MYVGLPLVGTEDGRSTKNPQLPLTNPLIASASEMGHLQ